MGDFVHDPLCAVERLKPRMGFCDCDWVKGIRERIAQDIELGCNHAMENGRPVACGKCLRAARIARGGESDG